MSIPSSLYPLDPEEDAFEQPQREGWFESQYLKRQTEQRVRDYQIIFKHARQPGEELMVSRFLFTRREFPTYDELLEEADSIQENDEGIYCLVLNDGVVKIIPEASAIIGKSSRLEAIFEFEKDPSNGNLTTKNAHLLVDWKW